MTSPATPTALLQRLDNLSSYLQADPDNASLIIDYFDTLVDAGRLEQAEAVLGRALKNWPDNPVIQFRAATLALATLQYAKAEAILVALIAQGIEHPGVFLNLAYALFYQGKFPETVAALQQNSATCAELPKARLLLAKALHQLGNIDQALAEAIALLEIVPDDAEVLATAALLLVDSNRFTEARPLAEKALRLNPDLTEAMIALGTIALNAGDNDESSAWYEKAQQARPAEGRSLLGLGIIRLQRLDFDGAVNDLQGALRAFPEHAGTAVALAWCHFMREDLNAAEACFKQAAASSRSFAEAYGGLAVVAAVRKDVAQAKEQIQRARRLNPQVLSVYLAEAILQGENFETGQFAKKAMGLLKQLNLPTEHLPATKLLYFTLLQRGNNDALH